MYVIVTSPMKPGVTLLIFTCEGREHLLRQTKSSFERACRFPFARSVLAVDGEIDAQTIRTIAADVVLGQPRRGYVRSILNALRQVDTEWFFWLEDDWSFQSRVDLEGLVAATEDRPEWVQIRLSKTGPLTAEDVRCLSRMAYSNRPLDFLPTHRSAARSTCSKVSSG